MLPALVSGLLSLVLLLNVVATGAYAQESLANDGSDDAPGATTAPAVDPLDVRQGGGLPSAPPSTPGVLATGDPPLTQRTADNFAGFVMWLLDAPLTQAQRQDLQDTVVQSWQTNDAAGMSTVVQMADDYARLGQLGETQRIQLRDQLQPQVLAQASQQGDDFSRWMLGVYNAAHQPLAPGTPPLTRQMSDANAEVTYFVLQVVATGQGSMDGVQLGQADFDRWAAGLASDYPSYTPEQQRMMASMPLFRAAMTEGWKVFGDDQKSSYRDAWRPIAEQWLGTVDDQTFAALYDANLVEHTPPHQARYQSARPVSDTPPAQPGAGGSQAAYARAMAQLQARHSTFMMLSGGMMSSWASNMNAINNIGDSPYTYVVK